MNQRIKVNYKSLGKPTSTTIDYALAEFYVNSLGENCLLLSLEEIRKIVQKAVNENTPDSREELVISKYFLERLLLELALVNYLESDRGNRAELVADISKSKIPEAIRCDKTPDMFSSDWQKNGLNDEQLAKLKENIYEFGDMNMYDGNVFKMHVENGLHYLEAFEKIQYLLTNPNKIHHVNGIKEILDK